MLRIVCCMQNSSMSMDSSSRCDVNQAFELLETERKFFQGKTEKKERTVS